MVLVWQKNALNLMPNHQSMVTTVRTVAFPGERRHSPQRQEGGLVAGNARYRDLGVVACIRAW